MQNRKILYSKVTNAPYQSVVEQILSMAVIHQSGYACIANVHMLIEAYQDKSFNRILDEAAIVTPDGMPLVLLMNLLYCTHQERIAGPDLLISLFEEAESQGLSIFLYGATDEVLSHMQTKLAMEYPHLQIAGMVAPPFRPLSAEESKVHTDVINQSGAHLVLVALGCPKQERWMRAQQGKVNAMMIGVGAAFPFFTGQLKRAPKWMQKLSLEWLFRLYIEPRRLFRRYLVTNTLFLILAVGQIIQQTFLQPFCRNFQGWSSR